MAKKIKTHKKSLRSILPLIIAFLIIGAISYLGMKTYQDSHAATGGTISVNPSSGTLTVGSTVSITVREDSGSDPINAVQASLIYDSNSLQYSSIVEGGAFPVTAATNTSVAGIVRIGRANADSPQTGEQVIVTVNFKVIGSGSGVITIDKAYSMLARSTDSKDVLVAVGNGSYTFVDATTPPPPAPGPTPTPPTPPPSSPSGTPMLYISPTTGTYGVGSTISAVVRLNGFTNAISTVEAIVSYPADQLEYSSTTEGGVFPTKQRTRDTNGTIDIIRAISGGSTGISGDNSVVTLNFKVLGSSGTAALGINSGSAAYDTTPSGVNILSTADSRGATYNLAASSSSTNPPPANGNDSDGDTNIVNSGALKYSGNSGGKASLGTTADGSVTELTGKVTLAPTTNEGAGAISKVEYYLNGKLLATQKTAPYSYNFDTNKLRNGAYTMVVKTYYASGIVDTKADRLVVKNKVTLSYVLRQYAPSALVLIAILAVCIFLLMKLVVPHFSLARPHGHMPGAIDYDVKHGSSEGSGSHSLVMDDPVVVAPSNGSAPAPSPAVIPSDKTSNQPDNSVLTTPALIQPDAPTVIKPTIITPDDDHTTKS